MWPSCSLNKIQRGHCRRFSDVPLTGLKNYSKKYVPWFVFACKRSNTRGAKITVQ